MARTKDEAKALLAAALKYGDMPPEKLSNLTLEERLEFGREVQRFWSGGNDDSSRDAAQAEYLLKLALEAGV